MNKFLKFLLLGQSINVLADHLLTPIFAIFILGIGGNAQIAGFLWGIQFAVSAVVGFFVLKFRDKKNLDLSLVKLNYLIKCLAWTLLIFNQSIPAMIIVQIMIGFASAIGGPSFNSLVSEHLDKNQHIQDWGTFQLTANIVVAISSVLGGLIMANYGFTYIFILMAILELLSLLVIHFHKRIARANY